MAVVCRPSDPESEEVSPLRCRRTGNVTGFAAHWNQHVNFAGHADRWFLNLFRSALLFTPGGYQTLNFAVMAAMFFGVLAVTLNELHRRAADHDRRRQRASRTAMGGGPRFGRRSFADRDATASDARRRRGWTGPLSILIDDLPRGQEDLTPTWAVFSAGWTLILALSSSGSSGARVRWAFPFIVVGMNSIAVYVLHSLLGGAKSGWIISTIRPTSCLSIRIYAPL